MNDATSNEQFLNAENKKHKNLNYRLQFEISLTLHISVRLLLLLYQDIGPCYHFFQFWRLSTTLQFHVNKLLKHKLIIHLLTIQHTLCPNKNVHVLFFEHFSQKSANFCNFWCTYGKHANNLCNFAYLKFHLARVVTIGYFRCIQFLRKAMEIWSDA